MPDDYLTVRTHATAEIEVKRSRFVAQARRIETEDAVREFITDVRTAYWDARHHCSAFVLGERGEVTRSSDDGEPGGTAGIPILQAIAGRVLSDVAVVVTRYFGGTLLGAGGLVRAYGDAAAQALDAAGRVRRVASVDGVVDVDPAGAGKLENLLRAQGYTVNDVQYGAVTRLTVSAARDAESALAAAIAKATQGRAVLSITGQSWTDTPEG